MVSTRASALSILVLVVNLPSGTVTFVFTDIEGSTALLKRMGDEEYSALLATHRRLVREIFGAYDGQEIDTQGDAFFYSFARARQAVAAAIELQRAHVKASWPSDADVRVRMGLHTGEPAVGDEGYTGLDVVRAARIAAVGSGGQILLSDTTRAIVAGDLPDGVAIRSLGEQRLKDIDRPEPLHELRIDDIPPTAAAAVPEPEAAAGPSEPEPSMADAGSDAGSRYQALAEQTRQAIETRVLSTLEESLSSLLAEGQPRREGPRRPPPPPGSLADEISRLQGLREDGALTEEQYARAVDRLMDEGR